MHISFPNTFEALNNKLVDFMFHLRGEIKGSEQVVIIDIDENSIEKIGQWPWSRNVIAKIIENLTNNEAGIIGLDIVFAEADRTSPILIASQLECKNKNTLLDYDEIFATTLQNSPIIMGYQFEMQPSKSAKQIAPLIPAIFIEKNKPNTNATLNAYGVTLNNEILQKNAFSSGFFNNVPDESGVTRAVPLVIRFQDKIYPSLALEMIRAANGINRVVINYNEVGIENIQLGDFFIPTDRYGRLLVNFRGKEKSFRYISAVDILENKIPKEEIAGKIFFIGTSAVGLSDLRAIPFEPIFPGVEIHANVIDNILNGDFLTLPHWIDAANIFYIIIIVALSMIFMGLSKINYIPIAFMLLLSVIIYSNYYLMFEQYILIDTFFPLSGLLFATIASISINYFFETKQKELIKQKFSSKVSKGVMEDILKSGDNDLLSAKDKEVTVFFSDVRGFTTISEAMPSPRALIDYLNRYLTPVTEIIIDNEGTIDKYIGDAVMAYWNAPADVANHQDKAIKASLEQFKFLKELNAKLQAENVPIVEIGIGINTGHVTVGEMGSARRSDYTVIGDPINLGSRLESLCKGYGAKIIISEFTKNGLKEEYITRTLDLVRVKGKTEPVAIFEIIDYKENPLLLEDKESAIKEVEYFNRAVMMYRKSEFRLAKSMFEELKNDYKPLNKKICDIYIERCQLFIETPPKDFDGVFTHQNKS